MQYLRAADLDRIEQELGVVLPAHYRAFHLTQQELIRQLRAIPGRPEGDWLDAATEAGWLVEVNRRLGLPKPEGRLRGKLYIGSEGDGGNYFISLNDPTDTVVYTLPHDEFEEEEIFDEQPDDYNWSFEELTAGRDMTDFARRILRLYAEIREQYGPTN